MPKRTQDHRETVQGKPPAGQTDKNREHALTVDTVVFAANGSPHKRDRCEPVFKAKESKHRRYYERNRELVRERQRIAHHRRRAAEDDGQAEGELS